MGSAPAPVAPKPLLSVADGVFLMAGMVIGVGIFKAPSIVAANTASASAFLMAWLLGGAISLCGALVYAELSSRHPETGGEYTFLTRAFGRPAGFLFAWSRMTVIQTGAIVAVAFVFGDYASEILRLGEHSAAVYAALSVAGLTLLNFAGTLQSKSLQKVMETILILALVLLGLAGLLAPVAAPAAPRAADGGSFGLAMVFVLLTYGGWNEAAYLAGEVREARRNMTRILVAGILVVTALYLLVNAGYLAALGMAGMRESKAVAVDVMRLLTGDRGAVAVALMVCVSALTTINAALFTGARTNYAFGRDFALFARLGAWREEGSTPANSLLVQGAISLALVAAGSVMPDGFTAMVAYTAPVFWIFFFLTGLTLFVFRFREKRHADFKVPLYPVVPLAFCAMCGYMFWSSVSYVRFGVEFGPAVFAGLAIMAAGIPVYLAVRR